MSVARVGKRGTLIIPAEIRKNNGIKEGDELIINVSETGVIYMIPKPKDFVMALKESGQGLWGDIDPVEYIRQERDSWD